MINNIFILFFVVLSALIPILLWGYLFSYFDNREFNRKRFFYWIFAGWVSVFPILYLWDFLDKFSLDFFNIFKNSYLLENFSGTFKLYSSLVFFLVLISIIPLIVNAFRKTKEDFKVILKNTLLFLLYLFIIAFIFYFLKQIFDIFSFFQKNIDSHPNFWEIAFNSLWLVIIYYLIIWLIEELSKFFSFNYSKNFLIKSPEEWVLFAIFTALGFAFLENILYFNSIMQNYSFWKEFLWVYFSRNLFSVFLHVICSSVFAYFFSIWYLKYFKTFKYVKILLIWFLLSTFLHSLFDIFLTLNMTLIVFIYLIWWYFYLSYIFYSNKA